MSCTSSNVEGDTLGRSARGSRGSVLSQPLPSHFRLTFLARHFRSAGYSRSVGTIVVIRFDLSIPFVLNRRSRREDDMEVQTNEQLLRNIEGYLMELVCRVESIDEVSLVADVLVSVQDALRGLGLTPRYSLPAN